MTPQNVGPAQPGVVNSLDPDDVQGDVLIGLQKNNEIFYFFEIADLTNFKKSLRRDVARRITSTRLVIAREFQLLANKQKKSADAAAATASGVATSGTPGATVTPDTDMGTNAKQSGDGSNIPVVGINLAFTNLGMQILRPSESVGDEAFMEGAVARAARIGDPMNGTVPKWASEFTAGTIHGVFIVTGNTADNAQSALDSVIGPLGTTINLIKRIDGKVRPERGHEHFGFQDGISQPSIAGLGSPYPGQESSTIDAFVLGTGSTAPAHTWMRNGSYMVFRQLKQLVPEWNKFVADEATSIGMPPDELGAHLMGRWKSGAPIATNAIDNPDVGIDPTKNNDLNSETLATVCPGSHIRIVNPRSGGGPFIMRAGIPFGDEVGPDEASGTLHDRGLLFVCYQSSIAGQFEFLQGTWANNGLGFGPDPVIGQSTAPRVTRVGGKDITQSAATVIPLGMAYFFVPSITAIICELSDQIPSGSTI